MQVKYSGYGESITVYIEKFKMMISLQRNRWNEVSSEIAEILIKDPHFVTSEDSIVNLETLKTPIRLGIFRFGAMGDLIQLVPIAKYIKRKYNHKIILLTQSTYIEHMKKFPDAFDEVHGNEIFHRDKYDKLVYLDGVLELDHSTSNDEAHKHRIKIYEEFFGIKVDTYDFSQHIASEDYQYVRGKIDAFLQSFKTISGNQN